MEKRGKYIEKMYLGPHRDVEALKKAYLDIKKAHEAFFEYAGSGPRTAQAVISYQETHLYPLYEAFENSLSAILGFTQDTQQTIHLEIQRLHESTLLWSGILVTAMILGFVLYQRLLWRMNRELYLRTQQFESLSRTIEETFLIFEHGNSRCEFVAENAERILGIPASVLLEDRRVLYRNLDQKTRTALTGAEDSPESFKTTVHFAHPRTRETRVLLFQYYRVADRSFSRKILTITDQTEEIHARQALEDAIKNAEAANSAKGDFLSRMRHEIRTPLNAIIGLTTIAAASSGDKARVEDCLGKITSSSKHLLLLINDILDMSKIESQRMLLHEESFDIHRFVNEFFAGVFPQARDKGLDFSERITGFDDTPDLIGDSLRLNQILMNIVSNAIKFTDRGGRVTLEVRGLPVRDGRKWLRFVIADTGMGMDEHGLKQLFQPFGQAHAGIARRYGGTGLGMAITRNLVTLMGGHIQVESEPGRGTTFTVELPFAPGRSELPDPPPGLFDKLHVLIADDEQEVCEYTESLLARVNIRAKWVLSGMEAVNYVLKARQEGPAVDICFIDWKMPGMDGIETTRRIREQVGPETPIIIISAYDWTQIEEEARQAGASAFISKPLYLSEICSVLRTVTGQENAEAEETRSLEGWKLLVAEDNPLNMEIAQKLLQMRGAAVESATNGLEAVELFRDSPAGYYDAILMDIQMPVMDGHEAARRIRRLCKEDAGTVPIIALTANAFTEDAARAKAAGMNGHVSKPLDMDRLCDVLAQNGRQ